MGEIYCQIPTNANNDDSYKKRPGGKEKMKGPGEYFREYCDNASINGFKYLAEKRPTIEWIYWITFIILSFVICFYFIVKIYTKFEENPLIISFDTKLTPVYTIPFPAVTICPMTKAVQSKVNLTLLVHKVWNNETLDNDEKMNLQYMSMLCRYRNLEIDKALNQTNYFPNKFYEKLNLLQVSFESRSLCSFLKSGYEKCDKYFDPVFLDEGTCYTFNMLKHDHIFRKNVFQYKYDKPMTQTSAWTVENGYLKSLQNEYPRRLLQGGLENSLEIFLAESSKNIDFLCADISQGFKVLVHNADSVPQLKRNYFIVPLDTSVTSQIEPQMITTSKDVRKYSPGKRLCYFDGEKYLHYFRRYSRDNCKLECIANYTLNKCGCVSYYMPRFNITPICGNGMVKCMDEAERELNILELDENANSGIGKCNCMPLCTEIIYNSKESSMPLNWRSIFRAQRFERVFQDLDFEKNLHVSKLTVYFKSEYFISLQRSELYGPFDLLANFGGLLGLFNGFSLLSLVEIVYYLTLRLWCSINL